MEVLIAWVAFPAALTAVATGLGLLVGRVSGRIASRSLVPLYGLAALIVVAQFLTLADVTAEITTPAVLALALVGLAVGWRALTPVTGWAPVVAGAVFAVYAAPIVLSGDATFAGYIRLDDTATWMALTDRVMEHGRDLDGLAPSSYEATLAFNLADGYPVGVFLPLGVGRVLVGTDVAWLIAPYMAWLAAFLAMALWSLARPLISNPVLRAIAAFLGAQSALLFAYYLWGGIKELAAAALVAAIAAAVPEVIGARYGWRSLTVPALLLAALVGVLSAGGLLWAVPALALLVVAALRTLKPTAVLGRAIVLVASVCVLALPALATGGLLPPTSSPLTDADASGNLIGALEPAQLAGIWPAGDFRLQPVAELATSLLIAATAIAAAFGLVAAVRARAVGTAIYVGGALASCGLIWLLGSPWVDAKALATASPAIPFAAVLAVAWLHARGRTVVSLAVAAALLVGIGWSNALAYRDLNLAPRDQLAELEAIGERIAGQGPTLMTEYQPYGVRHFLRDADPEGASELRRRQVPLLGGGSLRKGETADTDELDPSGLFVYRTLVLRRSPAQSRPPAAYELVSSGEYYDVWQRPAGLATAVERLPLGTETEPTAIPSCDQVAALASRAAPGQALVAARRPPGIVVALSLARYPSGWSTPGSRGFPAPRGEGTIDATAKIARAGAYEVWLGGSVRPRVELTIDGRPAGAVRHQLQNQGQYTRLGAAELEPGAHQIEIRFGGPDLHPGSGGRAPAVGPLALTSAEAADAELARVPPATAAQRLCGRRWDWIELTG